MLTLDRNDILDWLRLDDERRLTELQRQADVVRRSNVGDAVHLRGLLEISNHCIRSCHYCGLRAPHTQLRRYRLTDHEILDSAKLAVKRGYGTVVMQSGYDPAIEADWLARVIRRIKRQTPLAVTLSLGERLATELETWRRAGADRYLLRFETSDRRLYDRIHPALPGERGGRIVLLKTLKELGYEVGSGIMVGIPGQTFDSLADDIALFGELDLDMIGLGPFVAHPQTPLGKTGTADNVALDDQVPNSEAMVLKVLALTRRVCPQANIPSTTALATIDPGDSYVEGLRWGANVIMPNVTSAEYRALYAIYPAKVCGRQTDAEIHQSIIACIRGSGRTVGVGRGDSPAYLPRRICLPVGRQEGVV